MITDIKKKEILTALFADVFPYYSIHLFTQRLFFYLYVLHNIDYSPPICPLPVSVFYETASFYAYGSRLGRSFHRLAWHC